MNEEFGPMTTDEAREHLARLGWTQGDFARFFEMSDRSSRRFLAAGGVAFALRELTPAKAKKWMQDD